MASLLTAETVARHLALPEELVIEEGLRALLLREISKAERDIAEIRERYNVLEPEELQQAIAAQRIPGHPAWEDYLDWQNSKDFVQRIRSLLETTYADKPPLSTSA